MSLTSPRIYLSKTGILKPLLVTALTVLFNSCNQKAESVLTPEKKERVTSFVDTLNKAILTYNYPIVRESWNHELFKKRVKISTGTQRSVFDYLYKREWADQVYSANIELINQIRYHNGKLIHLKTNFIDGEHAEATYLMIEEERFYFIKYRIEILPDKIALSDIFFFKEEEWMSSRFSELIALSTRHTAASPDRHAANSSLENYQYYLSQGDTLEAYWQLRNIPKSHQVTTGIRIARLSLAANLSDDIFEETLELESQEEASLYMDYLIGIYLDDSLAIKSNARRMVKEIGIGKAVLDSLHTEGLYWD